MFFHLAVFAFAADRLPEVFGFLAFLCFDASAGLGGK